MVFPLVIHSVTSAYSLWVFTPALVGSFRWSLGNRKSLKMSWELLSIQGMMYSGCNTFFLWFPLPPGVFTSSKYFHFLQEFSLPPIIFQAFQDVPSTSTTIARHMFHIFVFLPLVFVCHFLNFYFRSLVRWKSKFHS